MDTPTVFDNTVVLQGEDVYGLSILATTMAYREGSRISGNYHIGRFRGKGFTCSPEFYADWKEGNVTKVTLTRNSYTRQIPDPVNPGKTKDETVDGWALDGYMTHEQESSFLTNQATIVQKRANLKVVEAETLSKIKLTQEKVSQLEGAV